MLRLVALSCSVLWVAPALAQGSADEQAWNQARAAGGVADYQAYLDARPDGGFAGLAFRCVIELGLMPPGHECSVNQAQPGPPGPAHSRIGNFPVSLR